MGRAFGVAHAEVKAEGPPAMTPAEAAVAAEAEALAAGLSVDQATQAAAVAAAAAATGIELIDREFVAAIRDGREPNSSLAQCLPAMQVMNMIEKQFTS